MKLSISVLHLPLCHEILTAHVKREFNNTSASVTIMVLLFKFEGFPTPQQKRPQDKKSVVLNTFMTYQLPATTKFNNTSNNLENKYN